MSGESDRDCGSKGVACGDKLSWKEMLVGDGVEFIGEFVCEGVLRIRLPLCSPSTIVGMTGHELELGWNIRMKWVSTLMPKGSQIEPKVDTAGDDSAAVADPMAKISSVALS